MSLCPLVSLSLCGRGGREGWEGGRGSGGELKCYRHTDIQTDIYTYIHTDRPSDEVGCRGAFAPKKKFPTYTSTDLGKRLTEKFQWCSNVLLLRVPIVQ